MIRNREVIDALAVKLKKIHPERAVVFGDLNHLQTDTTCISFETSGHKVAGSGEIIKTLNLDLVFFFKEQDVKKSLDITDDVIEGLGTVLVMKDRSLQFECVAETVIVDDVLHYKTKIIYRDALAAPELCEMDRQLYEKVETETGQKVPLEKIQSVGLSWI